jgi:hypothetical protein
MVVTFDGVHKSGIFEIGMHFKKVFTEILGCLKVLKVSGEILGVREVLTFCLDALVF